MYCYAHLHVCVCFQAAVCVLNTLQNNASVLERLQERQQNPGLPLQGMEGFLHRMGLTVRTVQAHNEQLIITQVWQ